MIFNSSEFLVFLPLTWALFWALNGHLRPQNLLVIVASYGSILTRVASVFTENPRQNRPSSVTAAATSTPGPNPVPASRNFGELEACL